MKKDFINDIDSCPYADLVYTEYDTGYREYGCELLYPVNKRAVCDSDSCPLSCKYEVTDG